MFTITVSLFTLVIKLMNGTYFQIYGNTFCTQLVYSLLYATIYYGYFLTETNRSARSLPIASIVEIFPVKIKDKVCCSLSLHN